MKININNIGALVLAAGKGTRMHSSQPKVLHTMLGAPMLNLVINALKPIFPKNVRVVLGHQAELVQEVIKDDDCRIIMQEEQLGTGHALCTAWSDLKAAGMEYILVVNGDTPLLKTERLAWFIKLCMQTRADVAFMTLTLDDPAAFGRVLRIEGKVAAVLEAKDYDRAAQHLKQLMNSAPSASSNLYIWGATIYKTKAARAKSVEEKKGYIDSVMLVYDRRVEYYGNDARRGTPYILQMKARDYLGLNPLDGDTARSIYRAAIEAAGPNVGADLILEYFQHMVEGYKGVQVSGEELLADYQKFSPVMANATQEQQDSFNGLFASSGAANCDAIEELYRGLLARDGGQAETIEKAYNMMSMIGCSSDFYIEVAEKYYANKPTAAVAAQLASILETKHEYTKALKYLNETLATETDPEAQGMLYLRIAASELGLRRGSAAAAAARKAIELDPGNGYGHMFLAEAYISGANGCEGFHARTVYWLAYDELARARSLFAGQPEELAAVETRMANCRASFPSFEDGFMYVEGYQDGKSYHVSCGWVSGNTTIRSR